MSIVLTSQEFEAILARICTRDTSQSPEHWTADNPLWGHCAVVSLLAQDLFGGELLRASLEDAGIGLLGSHYWNKLPDGVEHDFTIAQFEPQCLDGKSLSSVIRERSYLLSNPNTLSRYELLAQRLRDYISHHQTGYIKYPYMPEGKKINYVFGGNRIMLLAREYAKLYSLDKVMPGAAVIVKNYEVLGIGANGSDYHEKNECQRIKLGCKTGEGYEFCEGCHPKNHSEAKAIENCLKNGNDTSGADLYLWGHWWCCKPCWEAMINAGINKVFLLYRSEILFNKEHSENIVGRQFE